VNKNGFVGFPQLISHIREMWQSEERSVFLEEAAKLVEIFAHTANATGHELPLKNRLLKGLSKFLRSPILLMED
jgi:uncharacterized protein YyaL (SSP411 family)